MHNDGIENIELRDVDPSAFNTASRLNSSPDDWRECHLLFQYSHWPDYLQSMGWPFPSAVEPSIRDIATKHPLKLHSLDRTATSWSEGLPTASTILRRICSRSTNAHTLTKNCMDTSGVSCAQLPVQTSISDINREARMQDSLSCLWTFATQP